jgi:hypothetical protein
MGRLDKSKFLVTPTPFADRDLSKLHSTPHLQNPYLVASYPENVCLNRERFFIVRFDASTQDL